MRQVLEAEPNIEIKQTEITNILTEENKVTGVQVYSGMIYRCNAVILCTGTYLKSKCIYGDVKHEYGSKRITGCQLSYRLSERAWNKDVSIQDGNPGKIDRNSVDFSKMEEQFGDERVVPFSFTTNPEDVQINQVSCWLTYTNEKTHEIIRNNLDRSPLFSGMIEGTGPRYCPSIEDKVVKLPTRTDIKYLRAGRTLKQMKMILIQKYQSC